jgi:glycosyltransferase involved in cell wall biosynthesis
MSSNSNPKVSVVLAVYNGERYLQEAMRSLNGQSFTDFEIVVVDDASTDRTASILDGFSSSRLVRIRNETNLGQTRSLNLGLMLATGEYIARQDADDRSLPERLKRQVDYLTVHPEVGLLGTGYEIVDQFGKVLEEIFPPPTDEELREALIFGNIFCHGSVMLRKDVVEKVGGYDETFRVTQDYDLWLRIAELSRLASLDMILYQYRFDDETVTRNQRELQLAYRRLARELADERQAAGTTGVVPDDVRTSYPPEPQRLLGDARWAGYLYFAAGQVDQAEASLQRALDLENIFPEDCQSDWNTWALGRASTLARLRGDPWAGFEFLRWISKIVPSSYQDSAKNIHARYFADQAFQAFQGEQYGTVMSSAWQAMRYDPKWFTNRGLWSISLKSLTSLLRRI